MSWSRLSAENTQLSQWLSISQSSLSNAVLLAGAASAGKCQPCEQIRPCPIDTGTLTSLHLSAYKQFPSFSLLIPPSLPSPLTLIVLQKPTWAAENF